MVPGMYKDFFKQHGWRYIPGALFVIMSSYIATLSPIALGRVIDALGERPINTHDVVFYAVAIVLIAVAVFATRFIWRYLIIGNSRYLEIFLRRRLFLHLQDMSADFFNHHKTGDLIAYAINDIGAIRMTFGQAFSMVIGGATTAVSAISNMAANINGPLTAYALVPIPIIVVVIWKMGGMVRKRFRRVQEAFAEVSDRVNENINGIRVIKAYAQEDAEAERFEVLNQNMYNASRRMVFISSLMNPMIQLLFGISFMIALLVGSNLVRQGSISLGDFVAFNSYLTMIIMPIVSIGRIINIFQRGMASIKRLDGIMSAKKEICDGYDENAPEIQGALSIKGLTFTYPGANEPALRDINIELEPGQTLGVIGKTGCGKTTLASLLLKMYNVPDGKIFFDGHDINSYPLKTLRGGIGYVPQDNFLFSSTIDENIRFFSDEYTREQVEDASRTAMIYDNIIEFADGFDTLLGERGVNLSGGQKQRISIARALIRHPKLLILDDALSAVDTKTEESIIKNLDEYMKGSTGIIIAHRISAIQHADKIIVLSGGRIAESGTHEELMALKGHYYDIYEEQLEKKDKEEGDAV